MKFTKHNVILVVVFSVIFSSVSGYPITNNEDSLINKDEKRYPNGTVIGQYTYTDNEGNPIHVKYYANDASYGVELKSVKHMNVDLSPYGTEYQSKYSLPTTEHSFESALDPFTGFKDLFSFNKNVTHDMKHMHPYKNKPKVDLKNNVEFEILLQNELKAPDKCGKEKIKVYFDKDKRMTRNAPEKDDSMNYCNRF